MRRGGGRAKKIIGRTGSEDELPRGVALAFSQCQQAYHRRVLEGDLNVVQITALDIAKRLERARELLDNREDKDFWLSYEHPDSYQKSIEMRQWRKSQEADDVCITSDTMEGLMRMMEQQGV